MFSFVLIYCFVLHTCMCIYVRRWVCVITMLVQHQKKRHLECKGKGFIMEGDIKWHTTQCRYSPIAGQISGAEHGRMRVAIRPVVDRGEWWSHPTPSPGSLQKQEIQNSRKDPFFYQIPACNLAPSKQGVEREREEKAIAK